MKQLIIMILCGIIASTALAATEVAWIGGSSGNVKDTANWEGGVIPSGENTGTYIAVFNKSVDLTNTGYWYPAGIKITGDSVVTLEGGHLKAAGALEDDECVFNLAEGATFSVGTSLQGYEGATLVLRGGGTLVASAAVGYDSLTSTYSKMRIESGEFQCPRTTDYTRFLDEIEIQGGGRFVCRVENAIKRVPSTGRRPVVIVKEGGVFDCSGYKQTLAAISGKGTIDARSETSSNGLILNLVHSGYTFSGTILGRLFITPESGGTPAGSRIVIGDAATLADAILKINTVSGCTTDFRFAAGIGTFYVKEIPSGTFYDTDDEPVEFDVKGASWYVDCQRAGDDPGDGLSRATAFKTLATALLNTDLAAYDTVYVYPGVYSNGTMDVVQNGVTTKNRAAVPANVKLVAVGSAAETVILGAESPTPVSDARGNGPDAVRCVYLNAGATVMGFTLSGGRVYASTAKNQPDNNSAYGGGVFANAASCYVIGCTITNCVANRGGAGVQGSYIRCRIVDTRSFGTGAGFFNEVYAYNCLFDKVYGFVAWSSPGKLVNCTFGTGCESLRATGKTDDKRLHVYNSVVLCEVPTGNAGETGTGTAFHNCILGRKTGSDLIVDGDCLVTNLTVAAELRAFAGVGEDYLPLPGGASVDAGKDSCYILPSKHLSDMKVDVLGNPRVSNGVLDRGAIERDARVDYAARLALDEVNVVALDVTNVSGDFRVPSGDPVTLADGQFLALDWADSGAASTLYSFVATVSGTGTLTVSNGTSEVFAITAANSGKKTFTGSAGVSLVFTFSGEGAATLGAFANTSFVKVVVEDGGFAVNGVAAASGVTTVSADSSLEITVTQLYDSAKPCVGFTANGEYIAFADFPDGWTGTVRGDDHATSITLVAVYGEPDGWYVDPVDGDDDNPGYHRNAAWKSLTYAMSKAKSGETVYLLAGEYTQDEWTSAGQKYRLSVPAGVTVANADAPHSAVIVGREASSPDAIGNGSDAVSCVYLNGNNARVRGLTVRDGHSTTSGYGGGVRSNGSYTGVTAEDCLIEDCAASRGGAIHGKVACVRCTFIGNRAGSISGVGENCSFVDCVFRGNCSNNNCNVLFNCTAVNCTFLPDVLRACAMGWNTTPDVSNAVNCVILCAQQNKACYTHCAFGTGVGGDGVAVENMGVGSFKVAQDEALVDEWGEPAKGSPFVDAGIVAAGYAGALDAAGSQRVYNGTIDIGAYEYDWRDDFRITLTRKASVTLDQASPSVTTNALGGVLLPDDGARISTTWTGTAGVKASNSFAVEVEGEGELVYSLNGVEVRRFTRADGHCTAGFANALGTNVVAFAFEGEGAAVIADFKCGTKGLMLLVR